MFPFITLVSNIVLCSIPEEIYTTCFCLVLLGLAKQIKFNKRLVISVLVPAIFSNVFRYYLNANAMVNFVLFVITMSVTITLIYKQFKLKRVILVLFCTVTACMSNMILEILNYGLLMKCSPINETILKENVLYAFLSSIPFRTIELLFVLLYAKHKKDIDYKVRVNLWQQIVKNKEQRYFAIIVSIFNVLWVIGSLKLFILDNILIECNVKLAPSLFLLAGDILLPLVVFASLLFSIYCARAREIYVKSVNRDLLISRVNIAKYYANKNNYKKVETILDEVVEDYLKGGESF